MLQMTLGINWETSAVLGCVHASFFFFFFFTDGVISVFEFFASLISFASSVPTAGDGATAAADGAYGAAAGQLRAASAAGIPGQLRRGHEPAAARADTEPR